MAIQLLAPAGELAAITPRSFCNGPYFRPFRELLLDQMALRSFHLFGSRQDAFRADGVLQENIIWSAVKSNTAPRRVTIVSGSGPEDDLPTLREVPYEQIVRPDDPQRFIYLGADLFDSVIAQQMLGLPATLTDLGLEVSTGRVVDFRTADALRAFSTKDTVPLIYPTHLEDGAVVWPKLTGKKPNAIVRDAETEQLLIPNETYVLVKRFSAKEERRRVVATVIEPGDLPGEVVGFENHLNYFHVHGRGIEPGLAHGLAAFLNSTLLDSFFRQFNGHTQVNATDLRSLRYPNQEQLAALGERVRGQQLSQEALDTIVVAELAIMETAGHADPATVKRRIEQALAILRELGLPRAQQNERSALTLLALLGLTPEKAWIEASAPLCGITPMMEFFAQHYGKQYKPNTRETVRRQTVHQFLEAGIIVANPDEPERQINSPKAVYQIEPASLALMRMYGTSAWEANLRVYTASLKTLQDRYAQERQMRRLPVELPSGVMLALSAGGQNVLVKAVIEEFAERFTPGGEVLYVGDTDEKFVHFEEQRLRELGVAVDTHGKMPDIVIYYTEKRWLVLIEAVTSHGPINPKRRGELAFLQQRGWYTSPRF